MLPFGLLTATPPEIVSLQGTEGSPVTRSVLGFSESGETYNLHFTLCSAASVPNQLDRGKMEYAAFKDGVLAVYTNIHSWVVPNDYQEGPYYVRLTSVADNPPDFFNQAVDGTTWHPTFTTGNINITFGWEHNGPVTRWGTVKVEIATDSGGTNIVATGYYRGGVSSSP